MSETNQAFELNKRAESMMAAEHWRDAIRLLKNEVPVVERDRRYLADIGWCYFKLERLDEARKHLIRATKLAPENAVCLWALGSVYLHRKQYKKAEINLVESLRLKDAYVLAYLWHWLTLNKKKLAEAEKVHLEGIKLKPEESQRHNAYADFLSDIGREDEAQKGISKG